MQETHMLHNDQAAQPAPGAPPRQSPHPANKNASPGGPPYPLQVPSFVSLCSVWIQPVPELPGRATGAGRCRSASRSRPSPPAPSWR